MNAAPILQTVDLKKHYQQGEHMGCPAVAGQSAYGLYTRRASLDNSCCISFVFMCNDFCKFLYDRKKSAVHFTDGRVAVCRRKWRVENKSLHRLRQAALDGIKKYVPASTKGLLCNRNFLFKQHNIPALYDSLKRLVD